MQGFQDAGDALFPEERTHLNAPGLRLVSGNYRDLRFASGDDLYLLARNPNAEDRNLYAMKYSRPRPCAIPRVEWFATAHLSGLSPSAMAYLEEPGVYRGTVRFADTNCTLYPQTVESGQPTLAPIAAGTAKPIVPRPPELIQVLGRSNCTKWVAHIWCWPTPET